MFLFKSLRLIFLHRHVRHPRTCPNTRLAQLLLVRIRSGTNGWQSSPNCALPIGDTNHRRRHEAQWRVLGQWVERRHCTAVRVRLRLCPSAPLSNLRVVLQYLWAVSRLDQAQEYYKQPDSGSGRLSSLIVNGHCSLNLGMSDMVAITWLQERCYQTCACGYCCP